jgi:hypothetical protein
MLLAAPPEAAGTPLSAPSVALHDLSTGAGPRETRCAACHSTAGWREVSFAHDRTGFPLTGRHVEVACGACHAGGDFRKATARACSACHRDVHVGRLGARCEGCHDTIGWREGSWGIEAHRRTAFPLTGRHALVPCEECHGDRRDRGFSRPTPRCIGCHVAANFSEDCRGCHGTWRFSEASFPAHELCFQIDGGPHGRIACRACHVPTVPAIPPGGALSCAGDTADCLRCHGLPGIETAHAGVAGFLAVNRRCYECHRFSGATR